jgi:uncharacterized membrane protein
MGGITVWDVAGVVAFLVCWPGYHLAARWFDTRKPSLMTLVKVFRHRWIARMAERQQHIADATFLGNLLRGALFFASTTVFILGGLLALIGTAPEVANLLSQLPFATKTEPIVAEAKALALVLVFVYAFFKFTWSAWQYNVLSILVGAMPANYPDEAARDAYVRAAGEVAALAGESYNNGIRAYYFSIPLMAWFMDAKVFLAATAIVTVVLYRREFYSPMMTALRAVRD